MRPMKLRSRLRSGRRESSVSSGESRRSSSAVSEKSGCLQNESCQKMIQGRRKEENCKMMKDLGRKDKTEKLKASKVEGTKGESNKASETRAATTTMNAKQAGTTPGHCQARALALSLRFYCLFWSSFPPEECNTPRESAIHQTTNNHLTGQGEDFNTLHRLSWKTGRLVGSRWPTQQLGVDERPQAQSQKTRAFKIRTKTQPKASQRHYQRTPRTFRRRQGLVERRRLGQIVLLPLGSWLSLPIAQRLK